MEGLIRARRRLIGLSVVVYVTAIVIGCASLSLKQKAALGLQAAHTAVAAAQDLERSAYAAHSASLPVTADQHLKFSKFFEQYFTADEKVATVLLAWRAGDPVPHDLPTAMAAVRDALQVAGEVTAGADKASFVGHLSTAVGEVQKVLDAVGGRP